MKKPRIPTVSAERIAEFSAMAKKIEREEKDELIAEGRAHLARHQRIAAVVAAVNAARRDKALTLEQVAMKTGIGRANLSRIFSSRNPNPTLDTLIRIADAVGIDVLK